MPAHRSLFFSIIVLAALLGALPASAAEWKPYDAAQFAAAQKAGKSILVDIFAPWCPVCRAQAPILDALTAEPKFKDLVAFKVDFDTQKDDVRALKAQSQSTLIVFKGETEKGRSAGETSPVAIGVLLNKAL